MIDIHTTVGDFTWDFGMNFFVETEHGNYIWSDPDYRGDNTLKKYDGTHKDYFGRLWGRGKGQHIIADYCGDDVIVIED